MSIQSYQNRHVGERCFILGSGPSIADLDLSRLRAEISFASNWILNHERLAELSLDYYCAYDDAFVKPAVNRRWLDKLEGLRARAFFPDNWADMSELPPAEYVRYDASVKVYRDKRFSADPTAGLYDGGSVIINLCLPLALYMGFAEIVLLGVETDYRIGKQGDLSQAYFYDKTQQHTRNDHDPDSERRWITNTLDAFAVVREHADRQGVGILNATPGGRLEAFPRVQLNDYLQGKAA